MKLWRTVQVDESRVSALMAETGLRRPLVSVLLGRGHGSAGAIEQFRNPRLADLSDPFTLPGMEAAVRRVWEALDRKERIVVHGDYDADGITSTALLTGVLRRLDGDVSWFLPSRMEHGYGLSVDSALHCVRDLKPGLIITVDCGSGSREAVEAVRAAGVDVVVTDHHELTGAPAPAVAVVNPKLGTGTDAGVLAGVGVVFKLCHGLLKAGRASRRAGIDAIDLREYLDLVAIGTVADVAPLTGENRVLVRHGLARLNRTRSPGLQALVDVAGVEALLDTYHVGFVIGPRLNAAGRLGSAVAALDLLLTEDASRAMQLASELDGANTERRRIEDAIRLEAEQDLDAVFDPDRHFGLVVARGGWHPGTIGIVASRLVSKYNRPAVVIAIDEEGKGRGSCRSTDALDMLGALQDCSDLLAAFGGHRMAAGLTVEADRIDEFTLRFNEACASRMRGKDLRPVQTVDAWLSLREADEGLVAGLETLRPFGFGNATPVWGARGLRVAGSPQRVGKNGAHLSLTLQDGDTRMSAIGFNLGAMPLPAGDLDVLFQLEENTYQGRTAVRLKLQDVAPAGTPA